MKEVNIYPAELGVSGWLETSSFKNHQFKHEEEILDAYDYVVVGAGYGGYGAALRLKELFPGKKIAVFEAKCHYAGQQFEAGAMRKVEFDFTAMSFAGTATRLDKVELGKTLEMKGFIAQRSLRSSKLTVHITEFKIRS